MNQRQRHKLHGVATIIFVGVLTLAMSGVYFALEVGDRMQTQASLKQYSQELARVALQTEITITRDELISAQGRTEDTLYDLLATLGYSRENITLDWEFGRIDESETFTRLPAHARNPRGPQINVDDPPVFNAVRLSLSLDSSRIGLNSFNRLKPEATSTWGFIDVEECRCKARYQACLEDSSFTFSPAGLPNSSVRESYCRYGLAPGFSSGTTRYQNFGVVGRNANNNNAIALLPEELWDDTERPALPWRSGQSTRTIFELTADNNKIMRDSLLGLFASNRTVSNNYWFYLGKEGTCTQGTTGISSNRCLIYDARNLTSNPNSYIDYSTSLLLGIIVVSSTSGSGTYFPHSCLAYDNSTESDVSTRVRGLSLSLFRSRSRNLTLQTFNCIETQFRFFNE